MNQTTDLSAHSSWQVYGASSIGKSHIDSSLPNQDSIYLQQTEQGIAAVVCDGAGSAKLSQDGAKFFSQSIGQMLLSLNGNVLDLAQVKQHIIAQISQIRVDLQSQLSPESSLRDYHATVTGLLIHSNNQALLVQIGDSPLITSQFVVTQNQIDYFAHLQVYGDDSKNEYVNETHFITQDNWQEFLRVEPIDLSQVDCIALMSDGCADLVFEGASLAPKIYRPFFGNLLFNLTQSQSLQQGNAILEQALDNPATYRLTGDDKSLLVLLKNQTQYQTLEPIVEVQNEAASISQTNSTVWNTHQANSPNTGATSTPNNREFNPHRQSVTNFENKLATTSPVLPPSQSISAATRQRRNTAMMAGAAMLIGTGVLGWINKDRLLPTQNVTHTNTASVVASTTPNSTLTTQLTPSLLDASYTIDLTKDNAVVDSSNPVNDLSLNLIVASPQGQSVSGIEDKANQSIKNKNAVHNPLLSATVTTGVANKHHSAASVASETVSASSALDTSPFNHHSVKISAKASCSPVSDTKRLTNLGIPLQPTMSYQHCQISVPIKSIVSQVSALSKKTEILDSITLNKGLSEILTVHTTDSTTASQPLVASLPARTISDSSANNQIQLYYLGLTDQANPTANSTITNSSTTLPAIPSNPTR